MRSLQVQRLYQGWSTKQKRIAIGIAASIVILLIIVRISRQHEKQMETTKFDNCAKDAAFAKGNTSLILGNHHNFGKSTCKSEMEVNQRTLGVEMNCHQEPLNFFLFWSTARADFKLKHFRVIDSIFKYHPEARLQLFTKEMSIDDFRFYTDRSFDVRHHKLEPKKIFEGTPLARWAANINEWERSGNYFSHVTDAMRIALLWKYGGVYLDTDAPILRNIQHIRNAVGVQHPTSVYKGGEINGAVLMFDRNHPFLYFAMHQLMSTYDPDKWDIAGPRVITTCVNKWGDLSPLMVRWVPAHKVGTLQLPNEPIGSPAITVFVDHYAFYPHPWWLKSRYDTKPEDEEVRKFRHEVEQRAYAYHYVNHMVGNTPIKKGIYLFDVLNKACMFECSYDNLEHSITEVWDTKQT